VKGVATMSRAELIQRLAQLDQERAAAAAEEGVTA